MIPRSRWITKPKFFKIINFTHLTATFDHCAIKSRRRGFVPWGLCYELLLRQWKGKNTINW